MKGVILAAGKGTRMRPLTYRRPKPLVPVLDRPMLAEIIAGAAEAGVDEIAVVIGYMGRQIIDYFGDRGPGDTQLHYIWQEEAKGTGHAALLAEDFVGAEPFFMSWGDIIIPPENYPRVIEAFDADTTDCVLSLNYVDDPYEGAAVYVEDGRVTEIVEKPPKGTATTNYNNAGVFVHQPALFERLKALEPSDRGEIELPDAIQQMIHDGAVIRGVELDGYWSDVARPSAVLELNETIMDHRAGDTDAGYIHIARSAECADDVVLRPPIHIAAGCQVREGAVIGPNTTLVEECVVGAGAKLRQTVALSGARIKAGAKLNHCFVEGEFVIGEDATIEGTAQNPYVAGRASAPDGTTD